MLINILIGFGIVAGFALAVFLIACFFGWIIRCISYMEIDFGLDGDDILNGLLCFLMIILVILIVILMYILGGAVTGDLA